MGCISRTWFLQKLFDVFLFSMRSWRKTKCHHCLDSHKEGSIAVKRGAHRSGATGTQRKRCQCSVWASAGLGVETCWEGLGSVLGWRGEMRERQGSTAWVLGRAKALRRWCTSLGLIPAHALYQFSGLFFEQLQICKLNFPFLCNLSGEVVGNLTYWHFSPLFFFLFTLHAGYSVVVLLCVRHLAWQSVHSYK